ncbi:uroporphyrinogen-III C-methyltransferase [Picrophilus oshimae]|uniref:uroporphyrinogen-III C-methyltransferase n=1 Tax=Picrophilus torridus (strain ATCC 700027 / DSM 9790 / JCM 10055 / NBRC 100828 / KAW 2/3) TaxID=1122961 RepID=Q6KZ32_PICTO|nr:uroporphyrinogen-III C-methyltransferase [Picrophilus oshimae]AAT44020.1 uroporphyrin-III C-methyltransferase [Picrophilus oshimae DSM 9789]SMD30909.1 uroporphyrin-III C-methyltransferase [Picrophilus oshimae DSM 9789]
MPVYIIGAGPGNEDLYTIGSIRIIEMADVIIYDHLVNPGILRFARRDCILVYAGKKPYSEKVPQEEINKMIFEYSKIYENVVRLKGGDPFIFGRGGEEVSFLIKNNVDFVIMPGISSSISVPEMDYVPLTYRGLNSGLIITTGHNVDNMIQNFDLKKLSLVIMMGTHNVEEILDKLSMVYDMNTNVSIIENGTYDFSNVYHGSIKSIDFNYNGNPGIIVIGDAARPLYKRRRSENTVILHCMDYYDLYPGFVKIRLGYPVLSSFSDSLFIGAEYVESFFRLLNEKKIDIRNIINIDSDEYGKKLLMRHGIFKFSSARKNFADIIEIKGTGLNEYYIDYIKKAQRIVFLDKSYMFYNDLHEIIKGKKILATGEAHSHIIDSNKMEFGDDL